jgi:hypothetical protein
VFGLDRERGSTDFVRVKSYEAIVAANKDKAVPIARQSCPP